MSRVSLPHDAKAGPTKAEVRVLLGKRNLGTTDHFVEAGSCTGAVTIEAARRASHCARTKARTVVGDALFIAGSRNYETVLDHTVEARISDLSFPINEFWFVYNQNFYF